MIIAIEINSKNIKRCTVQLDSNQIRITSLAVVKKLGLKIGQRIESETMFCLIEQTEESLTREQCLRLLDRRAYSRLELKRRLERHITNALIIDRVLDRMEKNGLVDDRRYTENFISRATTKAYGKIRLQYELQKRGVERSVVDTVLRSRTGQFESEQCLILAMKKIQTYRNLPPAIVERRLQGFLSRHGFTREQIVAVLKQLLPGLPDQEQAAGE